MPYCWFCQEDMAIKDMWRHMPEYMATWELIKKYGPDKYCFAPQQEIESEVRRSTEIVANALSSGDMTAVDAFLTDAELNMPLMWPSKNH